VVRDWHRPDVSSTAGRFAIDEFGAAFVGRLRAGEVATIEDAPTGRRVPAERNAKTWGSLGVRAAIACPIVKRGRFVAAFFIHHDQPRHWSADDVALMTEVADRTWEAVERARTEQALRESEQRLREVLEIETIGIVFFESNGRINDANGAFLRLGGYTRDDLAAGGLRIDDLTPPEWREATSRARGAPQLRPLHSL